MEQENNEVIASQNDQTENELEGLDSDALKEKYQKLNDNFKEISDKNRQLFERAKKAEGFEKDEDGTWVKIIREKDIKKPEAKKPAKSGELDYGLLAFHNSKSDSTRIEHEEDIEFLKNEIEKSGKTQQELLSNKYFLEDIKGRQEERELKSATPSHSSRSGVTKKDLSYWMNRPYAEVPQDMRYKILDAIKEREQLATHQ